MAARDIVLDLFPRSNIRSTYADILLGTKTDHETHKTLGELLDHPNDLAKVWRFRMVIKSDTGRDILDDLSHDYDEILEFYINVILDEEIRLRFDIHHNQSDDDTQYIFGFIFNNLYRTKDYYIDCLKLELRKGNRTKSAANVA